MAKILCAALLLTLASHAAHAQTVTLRACNPGQIDVDVYFAQGANVISKHVAPTYCATLAFTEGAMAPGLVAVGFANAQGQWGGVHRHTRAPNFRSPVEEPTTQTLSVMHGATSVSIPAQFYFQPPKPACVTYRGAQSSNPFVETAEYTRCDELVYSANVLAFPDTREVAFQRFCQPCDDQAESRKTPELRAAEKQIADLKKAAMENLPISIRIPLERDTKQEAEKRDEEPTDRYLESLQRDPAKWDRIGWNDVPRYAYEVASLSAPNSAMKGSVAVVQGTLSGMERHNASDPWFDVFFQESPDHKFVVCTQTPDVLSDIFGTNYATAMVGKKIEAEGRVVACVGGRTGILLKLAHQIKLVGSGAGMVASVTPPAFHFPEDPEHPGRNAVASPPTPEQAAAATAAAVAQSASLVGSEMYRRADSRLRHACAEDANQRYQQSIAEKRAVDVIKERQVNAACAARAVAGAEQDQKKGEACARELLARNPRMQTEALYAGVATCMQAAGGSAQTEISNASAPAPAPAQAPVAAPAPPPNAPAVPQPAPASPQKAAAAPATPAVARAQKTRACVQETMQKLGPNALSDLATYQKTIDACMQR